MPTKMLTRAILLLVAMMTGLSAAQAEERLRPSGAPAGVSASVAAQVRAIADQASETPAAAHVMLIPVAPQRFHHRHGVAAADFLFLATPATLLSDRPRT